MPASAILYLHMIRSDTCQHAKLAGIQRYAAARGWRVEAVPRESSRVRMVPALLARRVGWFHQRLEVAAMRAAAQSLLGEHDFSAFRATGCQAKSPVKILHRLDILRQDALIVFDFAANGFLHHMVRNLVGALVYVGAGRTPPEQPARVLAARDRRLAAPTFSADGLYFCGVRYPARFGLPHGGDWFVPPTLPVPHPNPS